jgi:hypothetical protein
MENVSGIGPSKIAKYGAATLALLKGEDPPAPDSGD